MVAAAEVEEPLEELRHNLVQEVVDLVSAEETVRARQLEHLQQEEEGPVELEKILLELLVKREVMAELDLHTIFQGSQHTMQEEEEEVLHRQIHRLAAQVMAEVVLEVITEQLQLLEQQIREAEEEEETMPELVLLEVLEL